MITALSRVQTGYDSGKRQDMGVAVVVLKRESHVAVLESTQQDIEKIAKAAGVEMRKTAHVAIRRGMRQQQETGLKELNKLLQEIRAAKDRDSAITQARIATGYANAMWHHGLISETELKDVISVIGQAGEKTMRRIEAEGRPFWRRIIRRETAERV